MGSQVSTVYPDYIMPFTIAISRCFDTLVVPRKLVKKANSVECCDKFRNCKVADSSFL
jgi:hypothetical protein